MTSSPAHNRWLPYAAFALVALGPALEAAFGQHPALIFLRWAGVAVLILAALLRRNLTLWIFTGMIAGAELGFDAPHVGVALRVLSDIFLKLVKCIVAPLILSTLIVGIAGHGDLKGLARIGIKALVYFEVATTLALVIGLAAIDFTRAGVGLKMPAAAAAASAPPPQHWQDILLHMFPENIAKSVADDQILQVAVFALLLGIAIALLSPQRRKPLLDFAHSLSEAMFKFTNLVMLFAPVGVFGAMAYTVGSMGLGVFAHLIKLLLTLYLALVAFALLVLLPVALLFRIPVLRFLQAVAEPATIAFATASSEAALPRAMEEMKAFGVPERIVAFVIPAGYSFNLDGSTLYLAVASLFVAQAGGITMSIAQQLVLMFTLVLTSKGVAGVPRATLVVLLATASTFRLPVEPIFLILGIDALMDMARTAVNVTGNCLASAVVARWEGVLEIGNK